MYTISQLRVHLKEATEHADITPVKFRKRKKVYYIISEKDYKKMVVDAVINMASQQLERDIPNSPQNHIDGKPAEPAPEAENAVSQNVTTDPDVCFAVVIADTGLSAGKGANNLTYEEAVAFRVKHDINGEFEIVEQK